MPLVDPWIGPRGSSAQRLLRILREHGPVTRAEAARLTGMSVGGIRPLVAELIAAGRLHEQPERRSSRAGRGRPGIVLVPVSPPGTVLGLDFGHAHAAVAVAAVADRHGDHLVHERRDVDVDHEAGTALDLAGDLAGTLLHRAETQAGRGADGLGPVCRVVAGVPAPVDSAGRLRTSTIAASWSRLSIAEEVARRLGVDASVVDVENDARLGALGELRAGAGRGSSDLIYIKASHGLGAGLILSGDLYRGADGLTGEIGHAVVEGEGRLCRCGSRGCLETVVSVERVREQLRFVLRGEDADPLPTAEHHPAARRIVVEAGRALGRALADVCNTLNPQRIVLGGELAGSGQPLVEGVAESIRRYAQPAVADTPVVLSELGERAQLVGATTLAADRAREQFWAGEADGLA